MKSNWVEKMWKKMSKSWRIHKWNQSNFVSQIKNLIKRWFHSKRIEIRQKLDKLFDEYRINLNVDLNLTIKLFFSKHQSQICPRFIKFGFDSLNLSSIHLICFWFIKFGFDSSNSVSIHQIYRKCNEKQTYWSKPMRPYASVCLMLLNRAGPVISFAFAASNHPLIQKKKNSNYQLMWE